MSKIVPCITAPVQLFPIFAHCCPYPCLSLLDEVTYTLVFYFLLILDHISYIPVGSLYLLLLLFHGVDNPIVNLNRMLMVILSGRLLAYGSYQMGPSRMS